MMATQEPAARPAVKLFNGRYTVQSTKTGEHRTFWVRTQPKDAEFAPGRRVAYLLTGSQNDDLTSYTAFGFVSEDGIQVFKSKQANSPRWAQYADVLWSLALDSGFSLWTEKGFRIHMEGTCCRCNRPLTTPRSIAMGIGPICESL